MSIRVMSMSGLALALASGGCGGSSTSSGKPLPDESLSMHLRYDPGTVGMRTFYVDSVTSLLPATNEVYLCKVGNMQGTAETGTSDVFRDMVVNLLQTTEISDPFDGAQFFEQNGTFGYTCAQVPSSEEAQLRACLKSATTQCPSLETADGQALENLMKYGLLTPVLD